MDERDEAERMGVRMTDPPAPKETGDYEFPPPDKKDEWEQKVRDAIQAGTLGFTHIVDTQWDLHGHCPRCRHDMSNLVDTKVISSDTILTVREYGPPGRATEFETEVVCTCKVDPPHKKDTAGCGYGQGLLIKVPMPTGRP